MRKYVYFAHPLETCGSMEDNYMEEALLAEKAQRLFPDWHFIRPLVLIPPDTERDEAMRQCFRYLGKVGRLGGVLMLSGNWRASQGCLAERNFAERNNIEVIDFNEL